MNDAIDDLIQQWRRERPDLDPDPMGLAGRVLRLALHFQDRVEAALKPFGLSLWQFDVLATLRRSGKPYSMAPKQLMEAVMLSSGAMTNRIDRLEALGLVARRPDPDDRRSVQIELTKKGKELIDRAIAARFDEAQDMAERLTHEEYEGAEQALRKLLVSIEGADEEEHV